VVLGGSEGVGAAFARQVAAKGLNVVLVARRSRPMHELAATLRVTHGIETRSVAVDLRDPSAARVLFDATRDLEVGLLVYNAGADSRGQLFVDVPVENWVARLECNCTTLVRASHHFGSVMVTRGRGGIVIVSSSGAWSGGARVAVYVATKGFQLLLGESLWAEMSPFGVDVLSVVLGITDTPALREHLARDGVDPALLPMADPDVAVSSALAELGAGPTWIADGASPGGTPDEVSGARRERVMAVSEQTARLYAVRD
jgi:short-subunit dehydrogenase